MEPGRTSHVPQNGVYNPDTDCYCGVMEDRLLVTREIPLRDLIALGREAAEMLRGRGADSHEAALADALNGAAVQVATDIHEPARLVDTREPEPRELLTQ